MVSAPAPLEAVEGAPSDRRKQLELLFVALNRRKWVIIAFFVATVVAAAVYTLRQTKLYRATAAIVIDLRPPSYLREVPEVAELGTREVWRAEAYFNTEFAVVKSTETIGRVVDKLKLVEEPTFVGEWLGTPEARTFAIDKVLSSLSVEQAIESNVVYISVTDPSPNLAAILADAVAEAYRQNNLERRLATTREAVAWLDTRRRALATEVVAAEDNLLKFKRENILVTPRDEGKSIAEQRLIELGTALTKARLERVEVEARRHLLSEFLKLDPLAVSEESVIANPLVQTLKTEYVLAKRDYEGLRSRYGPEHPLYKAAEAKTKWLRENLDREVKNVLNSVDVEYKRAREKEKKLEALLAEAKDYALGVAEKEATYERLRREKETGSEKLYDAVLSRHKETVLAALLPSSNVHVLEPARAPTSPVSPRVVLNMALALFLGLLGGIFLALGVEQLDNRIKNHDEVEQRFGIDFLGLIPVVRLEDSANGQEVGATIDQYVWDNPKSNVAESCRTIRTNLAFKGPEKGLRRLLVTSAGPREGKTTAAVFLGATIAAGGRKTLVVDTDMRRPRLHRAFNMENGAGLTSVLLGEATLDDVILTTPVPDLYVLRSGPIPPNPAEILGSRPFRDICAEIDERFDLAIYDSPPLVAVSDPIILAAEVDGVLLIARAGMTTRDLLANALKSLGGVGANLFGFVLNGIDLSKKAYGYYYYQYYSRYGYYGGDEADKRRPRRKRGSPGSAGSAPAGDGVGDGAEPGTDHKRA